MVFNNCLRSLTPSPQIWLDEYADNFIELPADGSSSDPGQYRLVKTPYAREPLRELTPLSPTQKAVVVGVTQSGKTTIANNACFGWAYNYPATIVFVCPTSELAENHSKEKIQPAIDAMPIFDDIFVRPKSRDSGNTIFRKKFTGGSLILGGTDKTSIGRNISARYLICTDVDAQEFSSNKCKEGDTIAFFAKRLDAFGNSSKTLIESTPRIEDSSIIQREFDESSQGFYQTPCPICGGFQFLEIGEKHWEYGLKFDGTADEIIDVWYVCKHCHGRIEEYQKRDFMPVGKYEHKFPERNVRGFSFNALHSPFVAWEKISREKLSAKTESQKQVFANTREGKPYKLPGIADPDWQIIKKRAGGYARGTVPKGGLVLIAGFDTQDNRLEGIIRAWGDMDESWLVDHIVIPGDPETSLVWEQLNNLLAQTYTRDDGVKMQITRCAIDSRGHKTHAVYNFCRHRQDVIAIMGARAADAPLIGAPKVLDIDFQGQKIKNGVSVWPVGRKITIETVYSRLNLIAESGPKIYHFPDGLDDTYFKQLVAEKLHSKKTQGIIKRTYEPSGPAEVISAERYALAALHSIYALINYGRIREALEIQKKIPTRQKPSQDFENVRPW